MTDLDRLLFLHCCKIQAEKQDDIPFSSTKEYDDLKSEVEQAINFNRKFHDKTVVILEHDEYEKLKEEVRQLKFRLADEQDSHTHTDCKKKIDKLQRINRDISTNMISMQKEDERILQLCHKQVEELKDQNKQLILDLQDEAEFGLFVSKESEKDYDIVKRLKQKAGKYHGKAGWEFIDDLLQGILKGEKK